MGVSGLADSGAHGQSVGFFPLRVVGASSGVPGRLLKGIVVVWFAAGAIWVVCGVWAYGLVLGQLQNIRAGDPCLAEMEEDCDSFVALSVAVNGPFGVALALYKRAAEYPLKFRSSERTEQCEK